MAIYARQPDGTYKKVALLSYHLTDEILIADDSEVRVSAGQTTFVKLKEFTIFFDADTLRIYWEMRSEVGDSGTTAQIYKNDEPVSDPYTTVSTEYQSYKVDISADWKAGDKVQLYGHAGVAASYFRNFRILGSFFASR